MASDKHLGALKWSGKIETWYDRQIHPGVDWANEIDMRLTSADIVLLLVGPDFIASKYCWGIETKQALEMNKNGDNRVIPIYLRPVDLKDTPIEALQRLPVGPNPISKWRNRDEGFKEVVEGIRGVVEDLLDRKVIKEESKNIEEKTREVVEELDQLTHKYQMIKTSPILEGVPFMSLDLASITDFFLRELVQRSSDFDLSTVLQEGLRGLGLLHNSTPTYETLLCFGKKPSHWLPGAKTICIHWEDENNSPIVIDTIEYSGNLFSQLELSSAFLRKCLRGLAGEEASPVNWDIPLTALNEALVNALVHRDYLNRSDATYVEVYNDRVEVSSSGTLPAPMTLESIGEGLSYPRNPGIAWIFYLNGYMERVGAGIIRMQRLMEDAGLVAPKFHLSTADRFKVILSRQKKIS
jgi:hypothetical protein